MPEHGYSDTNGIFCNTIKTLYWLTGGKQNRDFSDIDMPFQNKLGKAKR